MEWRVSSHLTAATSSSVLTRVHRYGDVAPEVPELEKILFGGEFMMRRGEHLHNLTSIDVEIQGPVKVAPIRSVSQPTQP